MYNEINTGGNIMYEYKTEKVDPSSQQNVINTYALFG